MPEARSGTRRKGVKLKKIAASLALVPLAGAAYLALWPVPIRAVSWHAPADPGYAGVHAANDRLANLNRIALGGASAPAAARSAAASRPWHRSLGLRVSLD